MNDKFYTDVIYEAPKIGADPLEQLQTTASNPETENPSAFESALAGFRFWSGGEQEGLYNLVSSLGNRFLDVEGYNALRDDQVKELDPDVQDRYAHVLAESTSPSQSFEMINKIKSQERSRQIAEQDLGAVDGFLYFMGAITGAFTSPTNLIGLGWATKTAQTALLAQKATKSAIALKAVEGAALGGIVIPTVSSTISQTTQATTEEELYNWRLYGAVLGTVLGGGLQGVYGGIGKETITKEATDLFNSMPVNKQLSNTEEVLGNSVGAASTRSYETLIPKRPENYILGKIFDAMYYGFLGNISPAYRIISKSESRAAQTTTTKLVGSALEFKNLQDRDLVVPVQQQLHILDTNDNVLFNRGLDKYYTEYLKELPQGKQKMSKQQFTEEVYNTVNTWEDSQIKQVNSFAQEVLNPIFKKRAQENIDRGIFDEGILKNSPKYYFRREYDVDQIELFKDEAASDFAKGFLNKTENMSELEAKQIAYEVINNMIKRRSEGGFALSKEKANKALNSRTLDIEPKFIKRWLKKEDLTASFQRQTREHNLNILKNDNGLDFEEVVQKINEDYQVKIAELKKKFAKDPVKLEKKLNSLLENKKESIDTLKGLYNRLEGKTAYGEFKAGVGQKISETINTAAGIPSSQGIVFAQFPDLAVPLQKFVKSKLSKDVNALAKDLGATKFEGLSKETLIKIGLWAEDYNFGAQKRIEANDDLLHLSSSYGQKLHNANNFLYKANLMTPMSNLLRQFGSIIAEDEILNVITKSVTEQASNKDTKLLQLIGINREAAKKIYDNALKYSTKQGEVAQLNIDKWDVKSRLAFTGAIKNYVTNTLAVEPTLGSNPFWFDTPLGKLFGKFKGFTLRAAETHFTRAIQDFSAEQSLIFSLRLMLGTLSYVTRTLAFNDGKENDFSPERLAYEGFRRSGVFSGPDMLVDYLNTLQKTTGLPTSLPNLLGIQDSRLYSRGSQDLTSQIAMGVSYRLVKDTQKAINNFRNGKMEYKDWEYLQAYLPIYGAFYSQTIISNLIYE